MNKTNSNCDCKCENVLAYLKYSNPRDFCYEEGCLEWGDDLEHCKFCSYAVTEKFCLTHREEHKEIECVICKFITCIKKINSNDWAIKSNTNNQYICSNCRHQSNK